MDEPAYLKTYVSFIKILISMGVDTGISSIESTGNQVKIVFKFDGFVDPLKWAFTSVIINSDTKKVEFYEKKDFTKDYDIYDNVETKLNEGINRIEFYPYITTTYKLFEYLVFYPYYHILHTVMKKKNDGQFMFPNKLRRTGHNEDFITEWPTTGSPPTISNFKNMHPYIKWWKKQNKLM